MDAAAFCAQLDCRAGDEPVSDQQHADERCCQRTAKWCGPDAPTLASSLRMVCRPYRAWTKPYPWNDGDKKARSKAHTRPRVQRAPSIPHALCWAEDKCTAPAHRAARSRSRIWNQSNVIARSEATKQSMLALSSDGLPGHLARRRASRFCPAMMVWTASLKRHLVQRF